MKCYQPILIDNKGYNPKTDDPEKKYLLVRCNKCLACREEKKREIIARTIHEAQYYKYNYFILLTYDNEHCDMNLHKEHIEQYLKRLKKYYRKKKQTFSHLISGEYGENGGRPHYHMILMSSMEIGDYIQKWDYGAISFGKYGTMNAGIQSIFYTAGYTAKKANTMQGGYYNDGRLAPFLSYSKSLGKRYAQENKNNFAEKGYVSMGQAGNCAIPRYYKKFQKCKDWTEEVKKETEKLYKFYVETYKLPKEKEITINEKKVKYYPDYAKIKRREEETLKQRRRIYEAKYKDFKNGQPNLIKSKEIIKKEKKGQLENVIKTLDNRLIKLRKKEEIRNKKLTQSQEYQYDFWNS
nr:MAG: replication initiation protein [Microvirus Sku114]